MATPSFHLTTRYPVHEPIGKGGVGQVFRAWDNQLNRWVALKRLHAVGPDGLSSSDQIFQEAQTLASLQHPHIVTIYDFGTDEQGAFVVMELLEGENLEEVIARGVFPLMEFTLLARQALEGVIAAHHANLIHRDLKPSNLMLTWLPSGAFQLKILDFGLAKFIAAPQQQTLDQDGTMMGSVYTMAPEQFNRQPLDARTDLYALGCIFYYALAGQFPFRGETVQDVMIAHLRHHGTSLDQMRRDLPPALCRWVMRLISLEPDHRYQSAVDAMKVLNEIVGQESGAVRGVTAATPRDRTLTWVCIAVGLMALVGAGLWWQQKASPAVVPAVVSSKLPVIETVAPGPKIEVPPVPPVAPPVVDTLPATAAIPVHDLAMLRSRIGQTVVVAGPVVITGENKSGTMRYLNFDQDYKKALTLVFMLNVVDAPKEKLETYVGKNVQVTGEISEYKGAMQIVIKKWEQIEVMP